MNAQTETRKVLLTFHLPVRPYSPIDALNRRAAALGSPGYAQATAYADYNGHHVTLSYNSYRGYYIAQYFWAENIATQAEGLRCLVCDSRPLGRLS